MTAAAIEGACRACMRRPWLLSRLGVRLDYRARGDQSRVLELLELEDRELIEAIGGGRRGELNERWERFELADEPAAIDEPDGRTHDSDTGVETACRHCSAYPSVLRARRGAPAVLHVIGGSARLRELTARPAVAIVGSERPTDYGMEMAHSLARGLAASGVTVVSGFANGIAAGAHAGALEVRGPTVTVMAGGVDVVRPAARRGLYERVRARGCAVAEPPCGYLPRRWCRPAQARTIAGLVGLTIVVEADEGPRELIGVHAARALGQVVAAVPGRVTSPVSRGTNALLMAGAPLVRGPADALDLLYGVGVPGLRGAHPRGSAAPAKAAKLEPRLQAMLEQVGAGRDTAGKLTSAGEDPGETMLALAELELMGLLGRGDGGRYVPRESLAGR
jgi:DNA processing protein